MEDVGEVINKPDIFGAAWVHGYLNNYIQIGYFRGHMGGGGGCLGGLQQTRYFWGSLRIWLFEYLYLNNYILIGYFRGLLEGGGGRRGNYLELSGDSWRPYVLNLIKNLL